jgi:hypothetical protein
VTQACNPSYSGGGDLGNLGSRPTWAKSFRDPLSSTNGWVWWYMPVFPTVWWSINRRIAVQVGLGIKARLCLKNNQHKKGWQNASSGRAPAMASTRPWVQPPQDQPSPLHPKKELDLSIYISHFDDSPVVCARHTSVLSHPLYALVLINEGNNTYVINISDN